MKKMKENEEMMKCDVCTSAVWGRSQEDVKHRRWMEPKKKRKVEKRRG